jgi:hypothetical protein
LHNVLTHPDNHHRYQNGTVEYTIINGNGTLYYDSDGDEHPNGIGNQKLTAEFVPMMNVFYNRWVAGAPAAPPPETGEGEVGQESEAEAAQPPAAAGFAQGGLIDDFEAGPPAGSEGWVTFWDESTPTSISCGVDSGAAYNGANSLRVDFDVAANSWATCALLFDGPQGWEAGRGLSIYYRASAPQLLFHVDAYSGSQDARATYFYTVETVPESVDGWVHLELPWNQILRAEWEENAGSPVDPAEINGIAIGFPTHPDAPNTGTIWVDEVALMGAGAPAAGEQEAPPQDDQPAPAESEGQEPAQEPDEAEAAPVAPEAETQPEEGGGIQLCPLSTLMGALAMVLAGITFVRRRRAR